MDNTLVNAKTLSGFRDRLPKESAAKSRILNVVSKVFLSYGFMPIETPHLEYAETLIKQGSHEIQKEMYRFKDHGNRDVALRFDLTVPLARFIVQHRHELEMPFKRYAIGNVFRGERAQKGRYREFTQCDFDFIGSSSLSCDAEILQVIYSSLTALNLQEFSIWLNHREILNGIFEHFGLQDNIDSGLRIIDKLDKIGIDSVKLELQKELSISVQMAEEICSIITIKQNNHYEDFFKEIAYLKNYNESLKRGLESLESMLHILHDLEFDISVCRVNFSIARGLGYYTGIVYETTLNRLKSIGSVCSGGRYDNLTQSFSKEQLSGVGASIGIDRLMVGLLELGLLEQRGTMARALIIPLHQDYLPFAHKVGETLRQSNIRAEVYPDITKIKKSLNYANTKGHEFSLIIGEEEFKTKTITVKNMTSGMQRENISLLQVLQIIKQN
ncbi:histidine--tRNA ligase [Helicobacter aurati]|uniref:Histidine--tRNA ligase n=1 Tax=Helicobacter aurati TaxID=137778 RepID=A0A3D8J473_9HELI|nr:histidine--tRNA ligase [Helicobacter aurati]RDU71581.1 histidine--tRNA ligase [Helicobacter aurati]